MDTNIDIFSVTDLRHRTNEILKKTAEKGVVYLIRHSKAEAAVVDIEYLEMLREIYEDYLDTIEYDNTINLKRIPLEKHKKFRAKKA